MNGEQDHVIKVDIEYNALIVVQSLPIDEKQTGKLLFDDIIARFCDWDGILAYFKTPYDRHDFFSLMQELAQAVSQRAHKPILHFEIHGNESGLGLASGEIVEWNELAALLRPINISLKNGLLLTLAVCKGISGYQMFDFNQPAPVWAIVGPKNKIGDTTLLTDFTEFYTHLLGYKDIQSAIDSLNLGKGYYEYAIMTGGLMLQKLQELATGQQRSIPNIAEIRRVFLMED